MNSGPEAMEERPSGWKEEARGLPIPVIEIGPSLAGPIGVSRGQSAHNSPARDRIAASATSGYWESDI
jgi:hypothetical protein